MRPTAGPTWVCCLLLLVAVLCGCGNDDVDAIQGTWRPVVLLGRDYSAFQPQNGDVTVVFTGSELFTANDGCNEVSGRFSLGPDGTFSAEAQSTTDVGCRLAPEEVLPNVIVLERASAWRLDGGLLTFAARDGTTLGSYRR